MGTIIPVNPIVELLHSAAAIIVQLATALTALSVIIKKIIFLRRKLKRGDRIMPVLKRGPWLLLFLLLAIPAAILLAQEKTKPAPPNVVMMKEVWGAFKKAEESKGNAENHYQAAIAQADALLKKFEPGAIARQKKLIEKNERVPDEGELSKDEIERIQGFGTLHEVAASWWIKGRAWEEMGRLKDAVSAYEQAEKFPHALACNDEHCEGFWSPAVDAKARKDAILQKQKQSIPS
jgi:tetratricopeptide (TPR) repeat protein